jgi:hypothetical protein
MAACGHKLAGAAGAWTAVALSLSADYFLSRMAGGLPRGFALPLLAACAAASLHGRLLLVAASACLLAAFYPAPGVTAGLALAMLCAMPRALPAGARGRWTLPRRAALVVVTPLVMAAVVAPTMRDLRPFGHAVGPGEIRDFPEAGRGGRLQAGDRVDFDMGVASCIRACAPLAFSNAGRAWWPALRERVREGRLRDILAAVLALLVLPGAFAAAWREEEARRLLLLSAAVVAAYVAALRLTPHLFVPQRQVAYAVPLLAILWLIAAAAAAPRLLAGVVRPWRPWLDRPRVRSACVLAAGAAVLLAAGGKPAARAGLTARATADDPLLQFLDGLPADAYIAGWPNAMAPVPYLCARPVYVSYETHLPYRAGYALEMRRRMGLLIDAYFSPSVEPLLRLRDEEGITHFVVDVRHLKGAPPRYFRPFDGLIQDALRGNATGSFAVFRQPAAAQVYAAGSFFVLDLSRVGRAGGS